MNEITLYLNTLKRKQILKHLSFPFFVVLLTSLGILFNLLLLGPALPLIIVGIYYISGRQRYYRFIKSMHRVNKTENLKTTFEELFYQTQEQVDTMREKDRTQGMRRGTRHIKTFDYENLNLELEALRHIKDLVKDYKPIIKDNDAFDDFFENYSNVEDYTL